MSSVWPSELAAAQRTGLQQPRQPVRAQHAHRCPQSPITKEAEGGCRRKALTKGVGKGLKEEEGEEDWERKGSGKREGNDQRRARGPQGNKGAVGRGRGLPGGEAGRQGTRDPCKMGCED